MLASGGFNVLVVGVGGQGILTLSQLIGEAALTRGLNVLVAETHGLSQRGGAVVVHVRIGDVDSPLIPLGEADLMIGLELLEVLRNISYMRRGGFIVADRLVVPPSTPDTRAPSFESVVKALEGLDVKLIVAPASEVAEKLGDIRVANVYLLGLALSKTKLGELLDYNSVAKALRRLPNPELNLKALELGYRGEEL